MKIRIYILLTFLISTALNAQSAKEILDGVNEKYKKAYSYYIKFEYDQANKEAKGKKETGEVYAIKDKFNLSLMDITQIQDGKKVYTVSKDDKEVVISSISNTDDLFTPTKILSMYSTGYNFTLDKVKTVGGKKVQYIKLTPTTNKENTGELYVGIFVDDYKLHQYIEISKSGSELTVTIKEYLENLIIPKSIFVFDAKKYKGYVITEL